MARLDPTAPTSLYQSLGGRAGCRRLAEELYARVPEEPLLRPLFPGKSLRCAIEQFAAFLAQFLGGPPEDQQRRWWLSLRGSHARFSIGAAERESWLRCMAAALHATVMDPDLAAALLRFFQRSSLYLVNSGPVDEIPSSGSDAAPLDRELSRRWEAQRALDGFIAAVRSGDTGGALVAAQMGPLQIWWEHDPSCEAHCIAELIQAGRPELAAFAVARLTVRPELAQARYAGRTLLHDAAACGCEAALLWLLEMGVDPDVQDDLGHTPLYHLANGGGSGAAAQAVKLLAERGANVHARGGVQGCTALHMAARRGHCGVAQALLECGAQVDARDRKGDTPLRRALNCKRSEVAALLLRWGADPQAAGGRGSAASPSPV